jgi:hypothetical protein
MINHMKSPNLKFSMGLRESSALLVGTLSLWEGDDVTVNSYQATSSYPGMQYPTSWREKGGVIPPAEPWKVDLAPLWLPNVRGVEGNFYIISPYEIQTINKKRGDFGIHFDANAPGSLGCIVLETERGWLAFQRDMKALSGAGVRSIPLAVSYV